MGCAGSKEDAVKDGSTPMKAATPTHSSKPLPGGDLRVADVPDKLPTGGSNPDREAGVLAKAGNSVSGEDSCAFSGKIRDTLRCHADGAHTLEWTGSGRGQKTDLSASESCNSYTLEGVVDSTIEVFGSSIRTPSILGPENNRSMRGWNIIEPITEVDSEGSASLALRVEGTNEPPVPLVRRSTWNLEEFSSGLLQPDIKSAALMTANYIGRANEPCADDKVASATGMSDPGIGRSENQDAFTAYAFRDNNGIETSLLGVFDGHGPEGMKCSTECCKQLKHLFDEQKSLLLQQTDGRISIAASSTNHKLQTPNMSKWPKMGHGGSCINSRQERLCLMNQHYRDSEERMLHLLFYSLEENLREECNTVMSGTTGSVCVLKPGKAWIAAVGDSASILISQRGDEPPSWRLLSGDHRLTNEKEKQRVIEAGARVAKRGNQSKGHLRIWLPELDTPGLMVTRSLGDAIGKTVGVISEPEVQIVDLGPSQRYIVMASDGVWDVLSHDRVTEIVTSAKSGTEAAETIVQASLAAWHSKKNETEAKVGKPVRGIGDNITALVVDLAPWLTA